MWQKVLHSSIVLFRIPAKTSSLFKNNFITAVAVAYEIVQKKSFSLLSKLSDESSVDERAASNLSSENETEWTENGYPVSSFKSNHAQTPKKFADLFQFVFSYHRRQKSKSFIKQSRTELEKLTEPSMGLTEEGHVSVPLLRGAVKKEFMLFLFL